MGLTIKREVGKEKPRRVVHKIADIPGGVTVRNEAGLLLDGTPLTAPIDGIAEVIKWAVVAQAAAADATTILVEKGHGLVVDDVVSINDTNATPKAVGVVTPGEGKDTLTIAAGGLSVAVAKGDILYIGEKAKRVAGVAGIKANTDATNIYVKPGHNIAVNDIITVEAGKQAMKVTVVGATAEDGGVNDGLYKITLTKLTADIEKDAVLYFASNADAAATSTLKLFYTQPKHKAQSIVGTTLEVEANDNVFVDALTHAVVRGVKYPELIANDLRGIVTI